MNLQYKVKYTAGGYPNPTYEGTHQTGINTEIDNADATNQARSKARKEIARELSCDSLYVRINSIWRI